jgi:hypothetical protein
MDSSLDSPPPPENMGAFSDEHGRSFLHDISKTEKRCIGKLSPDMLVDYCWSLIRETPTGGSKRQKKTT